jgi:hypothetical protein
VALVAVVAVTGVWRPVTILAPGLAGLSCRGRLCTDRPDQLDQVGALYDRAFAADRAVLGDAPPPRRVVFCATDRCYRAFGTSRSTANTIADLGIVIGPRGWQEFYVRHELVHHWQAVRLGLVTRYRDPRWLIEGMAYALSDDPRAVLVEPNQGYRSQFRTWYRTVGPADLWTAAAEVHP